MLIYKFSCAKKRDLTYTFSEKSKKKQRNQKNQENHVQILLSDLTHPSVDNSTLAKLCSIPAPYFTQGTKKGNNITLFNPVDGKC